MKVWACFELRGSGPLGLASRAGERLGGRTVLEHAAARARKTGGLEGLAVLVEPGGAVAGCHAQDQVISTNPIDRG